MGRKRKGDGEDGGRGGGRGGGRKGRGQLVEKEGIKRSKEEEKEKEGRA